MRMVSSSTLASEIRTSPAITRPLSSTRSRMSIRLAVPVSAGVRSIGFEGLAGDASEGPVLPCDPGYCTMSRALGRCNFTTRCVGCKVPEGKLPLLGRAEELIRQLPQRAQIEVEVFRLKSKQFSKFPDFPLELHERLPHVFQLLISKRSALPAADGLTFQEAPEQFNHA